MAGDAVCWDTVEAAGVWLPLPLPLTLPLLISMPWLQLCICIKSCRCSVDGAPEYLPALLAVAIAVFTRGRAPPCCRRLFGLSARLAHFRATCCPCVGGVVVPIERPCFNCAVTSTVGVYTGRYTGCCCCAAWGGWGEARGGWGGGSRKLGLRVPPPPPTASAGSVYTKCRRAV